MDLSIIIPAYNEAHKVARDIMDAAEFLQQQNLTGQIIVVDDGSGDQTAQVAQATLVPREINLKVIRNPHRGKGYAVKTGVLASGGEYVLFADAGLCVPYENALRGLELLRGGKAEIAHGSRKLPESIIRRPQAFRRRVSSWLFRTYSRHYLQLPGHLTDTQCGFKLYRGELARRLFAELQTEGFMFDIEILTRALWQGARVAEFPIEWTSDRDSRLRLPGAAAGSLRELRRIKQLGQM